MIIDQSEFRNIKPQAQETEPKEKKLSLSLSLMILGAMLDAPFTLRRKRFKTAFLLWKQINCFPTEVKTFFLYLVWFTDSLYQLALKFTLQS